MKKSVLYISIFAIILVVVIIILVANPGRKSAEMIKTPVKKGKFEIKVTTTGELEAKSSEKILGPENLRNFRIWQVKIEDMIADGTVVDSGDYVAALDRTELVNKIKDKELELEQLQTRFTKTQLDTTLEMRTTRDNLVNLKYALEEKQIIVDQSIYEPPATQRQAQIELDKAKRNYEQTIENYQIKLEKAEADMREVETELRKARKEYNEMMAILDEFTVYAPKSGMVIYRRNWDGQKQGIGATINIWDPVVAELPNLREMISKTYVNEIDISKVKTGQKVEIGVDAFPDKSYSGIVREVANIGQQLPNSNAKVFEVIIDVMEYDSILRPAMTTKNQIITDVMDSVMFIPIECIHANDSLSYVYIGGARRQVIPGSSNENEIVIRAGLEEGEMVYLVPPEDPESYRWEYIDPGILAKFKEEEARKKAEADSLAKLRERRMDMPKEFTPEQISKFKKEGGRRQTRQPGS